MNGFKLAVSTVAVSLALSLPVAAYTTAEVDQAMTNRIAELQAEIVSLRNDPDRDRQTRRQIFRLKVRKRQIRVKQRRLDRKNEVQLERLVARFQLDVSPA